jgi:hypothetical protein
MRRILAAVLAAAAVAALSSGPALASGGDYVFDGGTRAQQAQVRAALAASSFDWGIVPGTITIHVAPGTDSYAMPGQIWLDADLLDSGRFAWATVQHEYAHQVDFLVLDDAERARLAPLLGVSGTRCGADGVAHDAQGCERFAETVAASFWSSPDNTARGFAAPARFRDALAGMLGTTRSLASAKPARARR